MSFIGLLNNTCCIEQRTVSFNSSDGGASETWSACAANVACRVRMLNASEKNTGVSIISQADCVVYMSYRSINPAENRLTLNGVAYNITGVSDMGADGKYLAVYLQRKA